MNSLCMLCILFHQPWKRYRLHKARNSRLTVKQTLEKNSQAHMASIPLCPGQDCSTQECMHSTHYQKLWCLYRNRRKHDENIQDCSDNPAPLRHPCDHKALFVNSRHTEWLVPPDKSAQTRNSRTSQSRWACIAHSSMLCTYLNPLRRLAWNCMVYK